MSHKPEHPLTKRSTLRRKGLLIVRLAFLVAICLIGVDAVFVEPYCIQLTTHDVEVPGLPQSMDGFRIVQLTDLHRSRRVPDFLLKRAVSIANSVKPDAVALTGDFVSTSNNNAAPCAEILTGIKAPQGLYAVMGNHDHWVGGPEVAQAIRASGINLLDNSSERLGKGLYIAGIDDKWAGTPDVDKAFAQVPANSAVIMLSHTPLAVDLFAEKRGLLLTGHTHGGQYKIPFIDRSWLPGLVGCKYIDAWYREGGVLMYVNRGVGTAVLPIRFLCRPEVALFILHLGKTAKVVLDR